MKRGAPQGANIGLVELVGQPGRASSTYSAFFEKGWGPGGREKLFFTRKKVFPFPRYNRPLIEKGRQRRTTASPGAAESKSR